MVAIHHRPLFGTRDMRRPHCVPDNHILPLDWPVRAGPLWQTFAAFALVDIVSRRIHLARIIGCYPQVRVEEAGPLPDAASARIGKRHSRITRHKQVADGLPESVLNRSIKDLPLAT